MHGLCSYKEPGELKISQLERPKDKEQAEDSSDEEDDNAEPSLKKAGKPAKKPRRASGASAASPAPRGRPATGNKLQARHSIDGTESLFGAAVYFPPSTALPPQARRCRCHAQHSTWRSVLYGCAPHTTENSAAACFPPFQLISAFPLLLTPLILADIVAYKPSAIPMALKQWWHDYDKNQAAAVCKLTNMMIEVRFLADTCNPPAHSAICRCCKC